MITIESYEKRDTQDGEAIARGQVFSIFVPDKDVIELDFDEKELALIKRANDGDESQELILRILLMIVRKVDKRRELLSEKKNG